MRTQANYIAFKGLNHELRKIRKTNCTSHNIFLIRGQEYSIYRVKMLISERSKKPVVPVFEKGNYMNIACNWKQEEHSDTPAKRSNTPDTPHKRSQAHKMPLKRRNTPSTAIYDHYDQSYWLMQVSDQTSNKVIFSYISIHKT